MRALALLLLTSPAMAQDLTVADCAGVLTALQPTIALMDLPVTLPEVTLQDGWCRIDGAQIAPDNDYQPNWTADLIRFRGDGLAAVSAGKPPATLEVQVRHARLRVKTGEARMDYLMGLQMARSWINMDFAAQYDAKARVLKLDRLNIDFPGNNAFGLTAQVDRIDLNSMGGMQLSVGGAGLTALGITVTSNGLFETYFVMPIGAALLPEVPETIDHAAYIAALVTDIRATVAGLPGTLIDAPSKAALDTLLAEMPHPWGTLTLNATAPAGFGTPRFMGFAMQGVPYTMQDWLPVFNGVAITATYAPSPKEE
jgi:hypothetical protein